MPAMPRFKGKPTKIAYTILGVPANMRDDAKAKDTKVDKRLVFEETSRVR